MRIAGFGLFITIAITSPALAAGADGPATHDAASHHAMAASQSETFVQAVREATAQFRDVNVATNPQNKYGLFPGCFSGPQGGAMGVHFVNMELLGDGELDVSTPEALVYEPQANGALRLVGVEYIVTVADWSKNHTGTPVLKVHPNDPNEVGQALQLVDGVPANDGFAHTPNRFGLPPFYELHVWAWQDNPQGTFADWNTLVSCDKQ
jgi:hypothetical protein